MISPGETIGGRYKIIKELGHGGMASVYLAEDITLGRRVAVKVLPQAACAEAEAVKNFLNEAKKAAALKHPNIVTIYTVDVMPDGQPYFAIEYLREDFASKLKSSNAGLAEKIKAVSDVLKGLSYAHEKGVIHRDIKPENIMFNDAGEAVIIDFGIAKDGTASQTMTSAGLTKGTPHYMSPEQCIGRHLDARSDIYSIGIVLYEAVAGRVPFSADETTAVMYLHVHEPPEFAGFSQSDETLAGVIQKALSKRPEERFQNALEFLKALNGCTTTSEKTRDNAGTGMAKVFFVAVIVCLAGLIFIIYYKNHRPIDFQGSFSAENNSIFVSTGSAHRPDDLERTSSSAAQPEEANKKRSGIKENPFTSVLVKSDQNKDGSSERPENKSQVQEISGADSTLQVGLVSDSGKNGVSPETSDALKVPDIISLEVDPQSAKVLAGAIFDMDAVNSKIVFSDGTKKIIKLNWRSTQGRINGNQYTAAAEGGIEVLTAQYIENGVTLTAVFKIETVVPVPVPVVTPAAPVEAEINRSKGQYETREIKNYYRVSNVASDDVLNIRAEPDPKAEIIYKIPCNSRDIEFLGDTERQNKNLWFKIRYKGVTGWVNSKFLTK